MERAKKVIQYYVLCRKLKDLIRTGWKDWQVKGGRIESVAEHVYGTQMLAVAMCLEYGYEISLEKVILMLAVHELEETVIGDLTMFQVTREEKNRMAHDAVARILSDITDGDQIKDLIFEFDERKTPEAVFAFFCDKMECDLQAKLYDEEGRVSLEGQENTPDFQDEEVRKMLGSGMSWSEMWMEFSRNHYNYDDHFLEVSDYAKAHRISSSEKF